MFRRLLKHQLKSTWKEINISYGIMIVASFIFSLVLNTSQDSFAYIIVATLYGVSWVVALTMFFKYIFNLFTSMYGKEAYLNFTLPVSSHMMVISKIIAVILYYLGFIISSIISAFVMVIIVDSQLLIDIIQEIGFLSGIVYGNNPLIIIISIIVSIISFLTILVIIHLIFALKNCFDLTNKRKYLVWLIVFGALFIHSIILEYDPIGISLCYDENYKIIVCQYDYNIWEIFSFWELFIELVELVGGYILTIYLIDNKVEIK